MFRGTVTRWLTTPLLTMAVIAQSFVVTSPAMCHCSTSASSVSAQRCCCSPEAQDQNSCCCSTTKDDIQSSRLDRNKNGTSCCASYVAGQTCQCGCSDRHPEPVTPTPSSLLDMNWESLFVACSNATMTVSAEPRVSMTPRYDGFRSFASALSVQVLCCIWLT